MTYQLIKAEGMTESSPQFLAMDLGKDHKRLLKPTVKN